MKSSMVIPDSPVMKMFDLSGRVALITGASGWLGASLAAALAEAGCRVITASRELDKARESASKLPGPQAGNHLAVQLDHLDEASIHSGFDHAVKLAGHIDILVNNGNKGTNRDLYDVTGQEFKDHLGNAVGYFLLARRVHDHAVASKRPATVIMLGSMYSLVGSYPDAYKDIQFASPVAYHTLKGGIVQMTRHLAVYWAKDDVRVNTLSPGPFPAPAIPREMVRRLSEKSPVGRMGQPHELKGALVFLASDASNYVTGHNLVVDGGWTAW